MSGRKIKQLKHLLTSIGRDPIKEKNLFRVVKREYKRGNIPEVKQ